MNTIVKARSENNCKGLQWTQLSRPAANTIVNACSEHKWQLCSEHNCQSQQWTQLSRPAVNTIVKARSEHNWQGVILPCKGADFIFSLPLRFLHAHCKRCDSNVNPFRSGPIYAWRANNTPLHRVYLLNAGGGSEKIGMCGARILGLFGRPKPLWS